MIKYNIWFVAKYPARDLDERLYNYWICFRNEMWDLIQKGYNLKHRRLRDCL